MGNSERAGILVPERFIPTPTTVSPQAQAFLSNPPPFEQTTMPGLDDIAGWREYVDKTNRGIAAYLAHHAQVFPADTVTHQLASTPLYEITPHNFSAQN